MPIQIDLSVDIDYLLVNDTDEGTTSNFPLIATSYEIFVPRELDPSSPDHRTYLFLTNEDGSKRYTGGWDIFCNSNNYAFSLNGTFFGSLEELRAYLDSVLMPVSGGGCCPQYTSYVALLSQQGGSSLKNTLNGDLAIGTTYQIIDNGVTGDWTNVGAPNNDIGTYFVATGLTPANWGNSDAVLESNSGSPTVEVLENNLGFNPYFAYVTNGYYYSYNSEWYNNVSALNKKVFVMINCGNYFNMDPFYFAKANFSYEENILIVNSFRNWHYDDNVLSDPDGFYKTSLEIRVYN
jgi:hypothetical protein